MRIKYRDQVVSTRKKSTVKPRTANYCSVCGKKIRSVNHKSNLLDKNGNPICWNRIHGIKHR